MKSILKKNAGNLLSKEDLKQVRGGAGICGRCVTQAADCTTISSGRCNCPVPNGNGCDYAPYPV